jgi:HD-GYP domain-containing protein (c-di-GMP phosphodiesterase class II)
VSDQSGASQREHVLRQALRAVAAAINGPDPYMAGHALRVADYADRLAAAVGVGPAARFQLSIAALFHDVGILATPAYILRKPSVLAEDEMEEIRVHPVRGASLFEGDPALAEVARAIRHHHERLDGTGYPDRLAGEAIPLFSRIILVAETYEALTHHRPYRRALAPAEAMRRLREGAGSQLDPALVEAFLALLEAEAPAAAAG